MPPHPSLVSITAVRLAGGYRGAAAVRPEAAPGPPPPPRSGRTAATRDRAAAELGYTDDLGNLVDGWGYPVQ